MRRNSIAAFALVAILGATGACSDDSGSATDAGSAVSAEEGVHFLTEFLRARDESALKMPPWHRSADELLPNVEYRQSNGRTQPITELVVVGRVTNVAKGRGFVVAGPDAPRGEPVPFETPTAKWWSVEATVEVERALGGTEAPSRLRFAMALGHPSDFSKAEAGLKGLGRVVLFLYKHPVWDYDASLYSVYDETYMASVADDGTPAFPAMDADTAAKLLATTPRLNDLESRGRQPRRTIPLKNDGGVEERP